MQNSSIFQSPLNFIITVWVALILGWLAGSLVNYLADVLPVKRKLTQAECLQCQKPVPWQKYFHLQWKCSECGRISGMRFQWVRILSWFSAFWLFLAPPQRFQSPIGAWIGLFILLYLLLVIVIDVEHRLILHVTSLFGALLGFLVGSWLRGFGLTLAGGAAGFLMMGMIYLLGFGFVRLLGRIRHEEVGEEAMGFGDVTLAAVMGLFLGWPGVLGGLVLTIVLGGAASLLYLIVTIVARKYRLNLSIPYGPFMALSIFILLFFV
jgi:leader peptidase (prepilin peptidase)/N-methyltransferase